MKVSSWKNSTQNLLTGAGFGIRIRQSDFNTLKNWSIIYVGNMNTLIKRKRNQNFTIQCPEIRSQLIGLYLIRNLKHNWTKGSPHQLSLTKVGINDFLLK